MASEKSTTGESRPDSADATTLTGDSAATEVASQVGAGHTIEAYPRDEFDVDVVPGQRRGAHRAATPTLFAVLPWLLVGLFVVACLVTLISFIGTGSSQPTPTARPTKTTPTAAATTEAPAPPEIDKGVRLLVLNGSRNVRTSSVTKKLTDDGWIVADSGNNDERNIETSFVVYRSADLKDTAQALVDFVGGGTISEDASLPEDMRLVVGKSFNSPVTSTSSTTSSSSSTSS